MMNTTKILRSPFFLGFVFILLLTVLSGLLLKKTRSGKEIELKPEPTEAAKPSGEGAAEVVIAINDQSAVLIDEERISPIAVRRHIRSILADEKPHQFVVKNTPQASYARYVEVYDAIREEIAFARERASASRFDKAYSVLDPEERQVVDELYPMKISEVYIASSEVD